MKKKFNEEMYFFINHYQIRSILIAISGGQDSICLIKLLLDLQKKYYFVHFSYIYIDHQWKSNSEIQARHIINYLIHSKQAINIYQIKNTTLSENIARQYRYHIIINHATKYNYHAIITAHTQTDKIETFFQNLIRGTTLEGATSLIIHKKIKQNIHFFRPLLSIDRYTINFFCRKYFLPIWSDTTNYDYNINRNRIRQELIPYIKKYFNNSFEKRVISFLKTSYYDNEYIKQQAISYYLLNIHKQYIALKLYNISNKHICLQTKVLRLFIYHNLSKSISNYLIKQLIQATHKRKKSYKIKWNNIEFNMNKKWLYLKYIK